MASHLSSGQNTRKEQQVWGRQDSIEFYERHRCRPEDLYPSEQKYLPEVLAGVQCCLDFGCAAGGFSSIMRQFNPKLQYIGVDVIPEFVRSAKRSHPEGRFLLIDGIHLPFRNDALDLVHSSGVLHLNSAHREILLGLYRVCRRYLLADFRLTRGPERIGTFFPRFDAEEDLPMDTGTPLPYVVLNLDDHVAFLKNLTPSPRSIRAFGYYHRPSDMARLELDQILMAFFLIEKGDSETHDPEIRLDFE